MSQVSRFDHLYRRILLTKFFVKGWGNPDNLKRIFDFRKIISDREKCRHLVPSDYPVHIDKKIIQKDCVVLHGHFKSPFVEHLPGIMPKVVETAKFQMILPHKWNYKYPHLKPVCLHLAGTGDHGYFRRRTLCARPLLKESGIASIILENPYYGERKPKKQLRSSLHNVSDLFVMGGSLILESLALFHWCERQGYGPFGVTGISMGGFMASLAASNWHKPIALIPCLSWSTASTVFCDGVMSGAIPWSVLEKQYQSNEVYREEISKLIVSPEKDSRFYQARQLGLGFAKNYPQSLSEMKEIQEDSPYDSSDTSDSDEAPREHQSASDSFPRPGTQSPQKKNSAHYHTTSSTMSSSMPDEQPKKSAMKKIAEKITFSNKNKKDSSKEKKKVNKRLSPETTEFMKGVMDECTHLGNFSVPVDPSLIIIVSAKADAYVIKDKVLRLDDIWPGSEVRHIDRGHITSFLFNQDHFRRAISDSFDRQAEKHYKNGYPGKFT